MGEFFFVEPGEKTDVIISDTAKIAPVIAA